MAKTFKIIFLWLIVLGYSFSAVAVKDLPQGIIFYDAQINKSLKDILSPMAEKAGLDIKSMQVLLLVDNTYQAYATLDNTFGVFTGFLKSCESVEEFVGVAAHEFGHAKAGHAVRLDGDREFIGKNTAILTGLGVLSGLIFPPAAITSALLGMNLSIRSMIASVREKEQSADHAAVLLLKSLQWPEDSVLKAMLAIKRQTTLFMGEDKNSYLMTHPLPQERIDYLKGFPRTSSYKIPDSLREEWDCLRVKLRGYIDDPKDILENLPKKEEHVNLLKALAHYRLDNQKEAMEAVNSLLKNFSKNPYYYELKAEIFWSDGDVKSARDLYKQALDIDPNEPSFKIDYARALIETRTNLEKAVGLLEDVVLNEKGFVSAWKNLYEVYGLLDKQGEFNWAQGEYSFLLGDYDESKIYAQKAKKILQKGSKYEKLNNILIDNIESVKK